MKIGIISDIHENFHNLILALQDMERHHVQQIICLGDLMNSGVAKLLAAQAIPTFMIWGNNDGEKVEITLASKMQDSSLTVSLFPYDFLSFGGRSIFVSHYENLAKPMAMSGLYDVVFYGHNHLHAVEKEKSCWIVNPGEIAGSKTKVASYALYDTFADEVDIRILEDTVHLKTPLMESYFKKHAHKMGLRSKKAMDLSEPTYSIIPTSSPVYQTLLAAAQDAKIVVFSGLPGVGKSLYINQFQAIAASENKSVTVIQWDIARKAFETEKIASIYPMGEGMVHNGVKLSVGAWLIDTIKQWLAVHQNDNELLLIEAPLVGHRFIEVATVQEDQTLESFFKSEAFQVIVPIPSKTVRQKIEADRVAQIAEDAKTWVGAKPSVMLLLWKMICGIANEMGKDIPMDGQPAYDPEIYDFVFSRILKQRQYKPLFIDEIFNVNIENEEDLHQTGSLSAAPAIAEEYAQLIQEKYPTDKALNSIVDTWYLR